MRRIPYRLTIILSFLFLAFFLVSCPDSSSGGGGNGDPTPTPSPAPGTPALVNFEADQQDDIRCASYIDPFIPNGDYTIFDAAGEMDDQCRLIWSYDNENVHDGTAALKTEGMLVTGVNGDNDRATCQFMIALTGTPHGTDPLVGDGSYLTLANKTVTAKVHIPAGSPITACMIILFNSGAGETALTHYASVSEGWNDVSYGFDGSGNVISINGTSVGPLAPGGAFNIANVRCVEFRLGGPTSESGVAGSADCTIDSINW
ncbi:MAG: hypothetical protein JW881_13530 [Spirochaetales bacterium]|nr:hypothetical protein [Spirochaetales bacterium]